MVMRSIYQGKCRSVTWVERSETFGAALACRRAQWQSVLAARPRPSFCSRTPRLLASRKKEGGGAPKGASSHCPRRAIRCRHLKSASGAVPPPDPPPHAREGRGGGSRYAASPNLMTNQRVDFRTTEAHFARDRLFHSGRSGFQFSVPASHRVSCCSASRTRRSRISNSKGQLVKNAAGRAIRSRA